jgi:hypothetical protein
LKSELVIALNRPTPFLSDLLLALELSGVVE